MAGRRKKGPWTKRYHGGSSSRTLLLWTVMSVSLMIALCLCVFDLDSEGESRPRRLETCRSACDARLQSAASEGRAAPSSLDSLFLRRDAGAGDDDQRPAFRTGSVDEFAYAGARPRRLPPLIKVLTGFGDDEPSAGDKKSIVARIERPPFAPPVRKGRGSDETLSHEDTVQMAAAAAAAAVLQRSARSLGNNRMRQVNAEWDAALRWIAGWDRRSRASPLTGENGSRADEREGFDSFVDDLARMLEECISQCVEDEYFEAQLKRDEAGAGEVSLGSSSIGNLILRSLFGWFVGSSFPQLSSGKLNMMSSQSRILVARALQVVASSLAAIALHSLWSWASPLLSRWYSSLGHAESLEWLLEHEKQLGLAKAPRSRQKKKSRRKQSRGRPGARDEVTLRHDGVQKHSLDDKSASAAVLEPVRSSNNARSAQEADMAIDEPSSFAASIKKCQQSHPSRPSEITVPSSKDSECDSQGSILTEEIPSIISYPSTSASSSPSLKPIGSHLADRVIPYTSQHLLGSNHTIGHQGLSFPQLAHQKSLLVPTQEQRDEASRQLREYQHFQIQRLLLRRKLVSQGSSVGSLPESTSPKNSGLFIGSAVPGGSGLISGAPFCHVEAPPSATIPSQRRKSLRPPPGLTHPTEAPCGPDRDDSAFLADNELLLSKLLDDEDEDDVLVPSPLHLGIESMSPESSLDPSAAPFVSSRKVGAAQAATTVASSFPISNSQERDVWRSGPGDLMLKEESPVRIKGVYGGSVW